MARERPDLKSLVGKKLTVIAWLWARTVKSPNPAFSHVDVPLASTFILSNKEGKEAFVRPVVEGDQYRFTVKLGPPPPEAKNGTKLGRGANFSCIVSEAAIEPRIYLCRNASRTDGHAADGCCSRRSRGGRVYLEPNADMETVATKAEPSWKPELKCVTALVGSHLRLYGLTSYARHFHSSAISGIDTFSDLVDGGSRERPVHDALPAGHADDGQGLVAGWHRRHRLRGGRKCVSGIAV